MTESRNSTLLQPVHLLRFIRPILLPRDPDGRRLPGDLVRGEEGGSDGGGGAPAQRGADGVRHRGQVEDFLRVEEDTVERRFSKVGGFSEKSFL